MAGKIPGKMILDASINVVKLSMDTDLPMGTHKITGLVDGVAATDAATKGQVDAAIAGLDWQAPVDGKNFEGHYNIAAIDLLTPTLGDCVIATSAGKPAAGVSDTLAIGDVAEFDGTSWKKIVAGAAGIVAAGTRLIVSPNTVDGTVIVAADYGKICQYGGVNNVPTKTVTLDGWAAFVDRETSVNENMGFVFDGTVPTGSWIQFTGLGQITAGNGLDKSGNTIFVKPNGTSVSVSGPGLKAAVPVSVDRHLTAEVTDADVHWASASALTSTPGGGGMVNVFVNGWKADLRGDANGDCYFAAAGDINTPLALNAIVATSKLVWLRVNAGFSLDAADEIDFDYNVA